MRRWLKLLASAHEMLPTSAAGTGVLCGNSEQHWMTRTKPRESEASALACDIVADAFGHDCGLVCRVLAQRGSMTLRELARETVLHFTTVLRFVLICSLCAHPAPTVK